MARAPWIVGIVATLSGCAAAPPPPRPARPPVVIGPSKARPVEPEVAELLRLLVATAKNLTRDDWGRMHAMQTIIDGGPLFLVGYGYPTGCMRSSDFAMILFVEYNIIVSDSTGCMVSGGQVAEYEGYNAIMKAEIEGRYGPVLAEAARRAGCKL